MTDSKRRAGVLMSISSLPSPYGVGVFGKPAVDFARKIASMGFSCWQVLPFTPLDYAYSPYGSDSAFAGNEAYISPGLMVRDGYVTQEEADECIYRGSPFTADYDFALKTRRQLLRTAFSKLNETEKEGIDRFISDNSLFHHCLFRALKEKNGQKKLWEWEVGKHYDEALELCSELKESIRFHGFVQYIFFSQWRSTKEKINAQGIKIIGDIPIYVSPDSADVFAHPNLFLIDKDTYERKLVAGVPPDYFSEDGQLWGNPLYNWEEHEKENFSWWISRIKQSLLFYDEVRIDHFRAVASFWAVDGKAKTAKDGVWMKGPKMKLFDALKKALGKVPVIAEDLGVFGKDVTSLLKKTGFPGMKIIQFGFSPNENSSHLPHNYIKNCVAYIGTHDNNTLLGWLWEASKEERDFALKYCSFDGDDWGVGGYKAPACRRIIETVWRSVADTAIIPFQDMCGFGSDARMNRPGMDSGNWLYRTDEQTINNIDSSYFSEINRIFKR